MNEIQIYSNDEPRQLQCSSDIVKMKVKKKHIKDMSKY